MHISIQYTRISVFCFSITSNTVLPVILVLEWDNGGGGEGEARSLFITMCVAIQLPDIFTTNKPLVLM
ncbi:hypothetical protein E2C01_034421 [Portunus trituberculatus]|uniref:Uncharacterized protein n=1 Tax=Portunus trituberculatus TaxID=210409 RepID=A0A5B7F6Y1_PORTR|nr:hypothetical protein [Portunus trituberculatus]